MTAVAYGSFASRNYRFLLAGTTLSNLAAQMLGVVVGWDLYLATRSPVVLGNVGLVQIIPVFLSRSRPALWPTGAIAAASQYRCRRSWRSLGFALAALGSRRGVSAIYTALFLSATARAFQWPANSALLPQTVPPELLTNAISWSGTGREFSTVGGPAVAGALLAAFGSESVYIVQACLSVVAVACFAMLHVPSPERGPSGPTGWHNTLEGLRFVWRDKLILSAMSLDLLAVFFGGAVALLPIFATDILQWARRPRLAARRAGDRRRADVGVAGASRVTKNGGIVLLVSVRSSASRRSGSGSRRPRGCRSSCSSSPASSTR
jgi:hypothetical protein